ncbi:MAG: hypothetical protein R2794_00235 [Chitinophagales bacterium]
MRCFLLLYLTLCLSPLLGFETPTYTQREKNLVFSYSTTGGDFYDMNKGNILYALVKKTMQEGGYQDEPVLLCVGYFLFDSTDIAVGYGSFDFFDYINGRIDSTHYTGLKLYFSHEVDFRQIITVLDNAIQQRSEIIKRQKVLDTDFYGFSNTYYPRKDTIRSISPLEISHIMKAPGTLVDKIDQERTFPGVFNLPMCSAYFYYYQNGRFHIYAGDTSGKIIDTFHYRSNYDKYTNCNGEMTLFPPEYKGVDVLEVVNIWWVDQLDTLGACIFSDAYTFYFVDKLADTITGPFTMHGADAGRWPYMVYEKKAQPVPHVVMRTNGYRESLMALFIPEKQLLISPYAPGAEKFIFGLLAGNAPGEMLAFHTYYGFLFCLAFCGMICVGFLIKG